MWVLITGFSAAAGIFRFIALFIVFIGILFLAFYFTKWYDSITLILPEPFLISPDLAYHLVK